MIEQLMNECISRNYHCSVSHQRITNYSIEIYTGNKKNYTNLFYSDGHISLNDVACEGLKFLNTPEEPEEKMEYTMKWNFPYVYNMYHPSSHKPSIKDGCVEPFNFHKDINSIFKLRRNQHKHLKTPDASNEYMTLIFDAEDTRDIEGLKEIALKEVELLENYEVLYGTGYLYNHYGTSHISNVYGKHTHIELVLFKEKIK